LRRSALERTRAASLVPPGAGEWEKGWWLSDLCHFQVPPPRRDVVPEWPQFLRGWLRYRQSLDEQLPSSARTSAEFVGDRS